MMIKPFLLQLSVIPALLFSVHSASAESDAVRAKRSVATIKTEIRRLKKLVARPGVRTVIAKSALPSADLRDSDRDGLPDVIENVEGTNSCRRDSDDDGISDGHEEHAGSNPHNSNSAEIELKDKITAISETTVTVAGHTFTVTANSRFRGGASLSEFQLGDTVEVSGKMSGGVLQLKKLSLED